MVEVTFAASGDGTQVVIEHSGRERLGDDAAAALAAPIEPEPGEWDVRRVIAHVAITDLAMLQVCQALVHGNPTRFENAPTQSVEVLDRWVSAADDDVHLLERSATASRQLAAALARLPADQLAHEVERPPVYDDQMMVDERRSWGQLAIGIQSEHHRPAHIGQLIDLSSPG